MQSELLITCEHAAFAVPRWWRKAFAGSWEVLRSHRGWDPGAIEVARYCHRSLNCPLLAGKCSRLLIELNRSRNHPQLWSEFSDRLTVSARQYLMRKIYLPYRNKVKSRVDKIIRQGKLARHLSVHSFTPVWNNIPREVDIGILFDPERAAEYEWGGNLMESLKSALPKQWNLRFNEPYHGTDDGLTTTLRQEFADPYYAGIEIEISQRIFVEMPRSARSGLKTALVAALQASARSAD